MFILNKEQTLDALDTDSLQEIARFQTQTVCYSMIVADDKLLIVRYDTYDAAGKRLIYVGNPIWGSFVIEKTDCPFIDNDENMSAELEYFARFISFRYASFRFAPD